MAMHFANLVLINDVRPVDSTERGWQFFCKYCERLVCQKFLAIDCEYADVFILGLQVRNILKANQVDPVAGLNWQSSCLLRRLELTDDLLQSIHVDRLV